jgi:hypothetical protein
MANPHHLMSCKTDKFTVFHIADEIFPDPNASDLPSVLPNIKFYAHNMLGTFPEKHLGQFDIALARTLVFAFKKE